MTKIFVKKSVSDKKIFAKKSVNDKKIFVKIQIYKYIWMYKYRYVNTCNKIDIYRVYKFDYKSLINEDFI